MTFSGNLADNGWGGGMYNDDSSPVLTNVTFSANSTYQDGGGMYNDDSSPVLTNVTFSANSTYQDGGGMYNENSSSPVLTNVTFSGNLANYLGHDGGNGGGMYNDNNGKGPTVVNSLFWGNTVRRGGRTQGSQIYLSNDKGSGSGPENLTLYNCIVQGGIAQSAVQTSQTSPLSLAEVGGGIGVSKTKQDEGTPVSITYAKVYGANTNDAPKLGALAQNGGSVPTMALRAESFAIDKGVYIMQMGQKGGDLYYSNVRASSGATWYLNTHPSLAASSKPSVSATALPAGAPINIDLTAKDARGYRRVGRPDIGAFEYGGMAPRP